MDGSLAALRAFLAAGPAALVEVIEARGSTPRERGAWMLVSADTILGTIGGGQLEFMAIDEARRMLRGGDAGSVDQEATKLSVPLGPEIGQCCGGKVGLSVRIAGAAARRSLLARAAQDDAARPHVHVFGGGHVGTALAAALRLLPVRTIVVESRSEALLGMPGDVETRLTAVPEEVVRAAAPGSAFLVLTHDHALDFLIVAEALRRADAAYVGMIGSMTKKATFRSWYFRNGGGTEQAFARLVSPIGGGAVRDKRPSVIAALAAAEVMTALTAHGSPAGAMPGGSGASAASRHG
ncbi:MAG: xanthine dehydrogenase accessory protein XdhC [Rhizobiaceae bacterium]|nr:xanthine dehydrogenase accessory protein XdhC [Rhizobiaceae bacterium]